MKNQTSYYLSAHKKCVTMHMEGSIGINFFCCDQFG